MIKPDIIIHERGTDNKNLIAIEIKKGNADKEDKKDDKERLEKFTDPNRPDEYRFNYKLGIYIEFSTNGKDDIYNYFANGKKL